MISPVLVKVTAGGEHMEAGQSQRAMDPGKRLGTGGLGVGARPWPAEGPTRPEEPLGVS